MLHVTYLGVGFDHQLRWYIKLGEYLEDRLQVDESG